MSRRAKPRTLCGVIDSLEGDWALIALDDGQRLDWPRDRLPAQSLAGMAVVIDLRDAVEVAAQEGEGTWEGVVGVQTQERKSRTVIQLGDQSLIWPAGKGLSYGKRVVVRMQTDADDTERRRRQVQSLVDDLFG